jgi:hypothetical protein
LRFIRSKYGMIDDGHSAVQYVGAWKRQLHPIARISKVMMTMEDRRATKTKAETNPLKKSG